jgi:hypothetical protein
MIHPSLSAWTKYCPNAPTINALIAERCEGRKPRLTT